MRKKLSYLSLIILATSFTQSIYSVAPRAEISLVGSKHNSYNLVLYVNPNCPYCKKVTNYLESQKRTILTKNTQDRAVRNELVSIGGKGQVPCLVINGKALYESDAIIEWLKNHP